MWGAIAGAVVNNNTEFEVAVSIHDSVYNTDFTSTTIPYSPSNPDRNAKEIEQYVLQTLRKFSMGHLCKFLGVGVTLALLKEVWYSTDFMISLLIELPVPVSKLVYSTVVGHGYCPVCVQHQAIPHRLFDASKRQAPHLFDYRFLCTIRCRNTHPVHRLGSNWCRRITDRTF